jgi:hypothetical protein
MKVTPPTLTRAAQMKPRLTITLAGIGATSVIYLAVTLVLMHVIQPGLNPAKHYVSEYALGQAGGHMMFAYVVAGAGVLGIAWSAGSILPGKRGRAVGTGLVLVGVSIIVTGVTRIDIPAADGSMTPTVSGTVHELIGYVTFVGLLPASFLLAGAFRNDPRLSSAARRAWIFAVAIVVALVAAVTSQSLDLAGVGQRILLVTLIAWLIFVALQLSRVERLSTPSRPELRQ